jgi:hypothetical protein
MLSAMSPGCKIDQEHRGSQRSSCQARGASHAPPQTANGPVYRPLPPEIIWIQRRTARPYTLPLAGAQCTVHMQVYQVLVLRFAQLVLISAAVFSLHAHTHHRGECFAAMLWLSKPPPPSCGPSAVRLRTRCSKPMLFSLLTSLLPFFWGR